ncbi:MAG: serine/threonine protein kinase, partial [Planctomycetota bacterium]
MDTDPFPDRLSQNELSAQDLFDDYLTRHESGDTEGFEVWLKAHPERQDELRVAWSDHRRALDALAREAAPHSRSSAGSFALKAGSILGEFQLVRPLGQGGQGTVWEAEQPSLDRRVALKFVRPERVNEHTLARFQQEARAGGRLTHPGIVAVYAWGETNEVHWIAQELVPGGRTIRNWIDESRQDGDLSDAYYGEVAEFIAKLCDALQTAHDGGVIHRDVKPLNILVTPTGQPKLTDFGLARLSEEPGLSASGDIVGTYAYMSPEQLGAKRSGIDARTDIFSLGIVLYELLSLQRPFDGDSTQQIAYKILHEEPPKLTDIRSRTPRDLAVICGKSLEKDPEKRYATMVEFAADIARHIANEPIRAHPPTRFERIVKWTKRNPTKSAATIVSALAFVVISTMAVQLSKQKEDLQTTNTDLASRTDDLTAANTALQTKTEEAQRKTTDVLRLSLGQDFEDLMSEAGALWPPHPEKIEGLETWLSDARGLTGEIPSLVAKRDELRSLALPQSAEERRLERESHPDFVELERMEGELVFRRRALAQRRDGKETELPEVDWSVAPGDAAGLGARARARALVAGGRTAFGKEALGVVLAERAIELASDGERSEIAATLSQGYFALGRDDEALGMAFMAVDEAGASERAGREVALVALEKAVAEKGSEEGIAAEVEAMGQLEVRVSDLEKRVSERRDWTFPEETEQETRARWWHNQLSGLIVELGSLSAAGTGLLTEDGVSQEHGWSVARRLGLARRMEAGFEGGGEYGVRWDAALPEIHAAYPGLNLTPQMGLVPIGADADSGLWEFWHVQTGTEPARGGDGKLEMEDGTGLVFVLLPGGKFWMGAQARDPEGRNHDPDAQSNEGPVHEVELSAFFLSKYEMTQGQWERMAGRNPSRWTAETFGGGWIEGPNPVEQVSWFDCMGLLPKLSLRLPSEAQWEYACRGGTDTV